MTVSLISAWSQAWKSHIGNMAFENFEGYALRNSYNFFAQVPRDPSIHYTNWLKLKVARSEMDRLKDGDLLFVLDADLLITNWGVRVEWFAKGEYTMWITKDCNSINAGSFIMKKSSKSVWLLDQIIALNHKYTCEQNAIEELMLGNPGICILDHPSINSYIYSEYGLKKGHKDGNWQPGDFILHIPARSIERRIEIMQTTPIWK